ncbi:MAG: hypothetical protein JW866_05655 [Ignavibacteriales bacterium]|nr:hypothetical protein [Ignavibacteriales bacterium]
MPIAYAECKDVTVDIGDKTVQKQAKRYVEAFGRILLTNYFDFEIINESGDVAKVSIGEKVENNIQPKEASFEKFTNLIEDYITPEHRTITSAKKLAEIMASKARLLRDNALASLTENPDSDIHAQYITFKEVLIHDLGEKEFADMYAQTLVYGLFVARYFDPTLPTFSRHEAQDLLPSTNPLLKKFFGHVAGTDYDPKIAWLVDSLIEAYLSTDVAGIMHKEFQKKQKDPVLHFYETFLLEYDKDLRKSRGVYYTPVPVVSFIVRSVDQILKTKFNLSKGLRDETKIDYKEKISQADGRTKDGIKQVDKKIHKVQILDPAVGTGTFLNEVIHEIYKSFKGQEGMWPGYVKDNLLPRLHGFELMMASYTMAHLKLGVTLKELGYKGHERLSIWLTNSLEEGVHEVPNLFMSQWLTEESNHASFIKSELPIMVVIGNPPYSGESFNKKYTGHDVYKVEPGGKQKLQEKNSKWINDDYVKFIRFAEKQIEKTGEGVVSFITNHGYIDNPTFRGMRWHLMKTFDEIYILDLHGSSIKKEITPDGGKDENVFGIKAGTAIIFAINKGNNDKHAKIYHAEFYGKQNTKYQKLNENSWESIKWKKLLPKEPNLYFAPLDNGIKEKYDQGFSVEEIFLLQNTGIVAKRDFLCYQDKKEKLIQIGEDMMNMEENDVRNKYLIPKDSDWVLNRAINDIKNIKADNEFIKEVGYRPFENKFTFYTGENRGFLARPVAKIANHFHKIDNISLITSKQGGAAHPTNWNTLFISKNIIDLNFYRRGGANSFPLYLCNENGIKTPSLKQAIWQKINEITGETKPEDILDYIYAVLHSPNYRQKYKEFLKIDFPRVPYPSDKKIFWKLVELGRELRGLHLLESPKVSDFITTFSVGGSNIVEKKYPIYKDNNVYINEAQYFGNVPESAWNFYIGGYQPTQKWLKDRHERELSSKDIEHYQKIIVALTETNRIMQEIDKIFNS